jgi:hypothetical protein
MQASYNASNKEVTIISNLTEYRWIALMCSASFFGPVTGQILGLVVESAKNTETQDDFLTEVEAIFTKLRDQNPMMGDEGKDSLNYIETMAKALPFEIVKEMDTWFSGEAEQQSSAV